MLFTYSVKVIVDMREFRWINSRIRFAGRSSYVDCRGLHPDITFVRGAEEHT